MNIFVVLCFRWFVLLNSIDLVLLPLLDHDILVLFALLALSFCIETKTESESLRRDTSLSRLPWEGMLVIHQWLPERLPSSNWPGLYKSKKPFALFAYLQMSFRIWNILSFSGMAFYFSHKIQDIVICCKLMSQVARHQKSFLWGEDYFSIWKKIGLLTWQ
jgi:hypothetical protein